MLYNKTRMLLCRVPLQKSVKCLQMDTAIAMWQLLFSGDQRWPLVDAWCAFLQKHHKVAISKDTWVQLLEFARVRLQLFSSAIMCRAAACATLFVRGALTSQLSRCVLYLAVLSKVCLACVQQIKPDFSNYDENAAWPYLLVSG